MIKYNTIDKQNVLCLKEELSYSRHFYKYQYGLEKNF